ncbi:MAG: phosphoribosyltransferase [Armatimonadota bacterium]|nr:phosphoribosyltransferase [bacterium]
MITEPFTDRKEAGKALGKALEHLKSTDCIVLAIPRGGVVVAYEVARMLGRQMDVIVPRKLRAPGQPELAIGAVASWGDHERLLDEQTVAMLAVSPQYIEREVELQLAEINRRLVAYRGTTDPPDIAGRTVILVDDGIATGYTTRAAAVAARNLGASAIILAVPVAPPDSTEAMGAYVDELICLKTPFPFMAVGYWYRDFEQVSDEEVIRLLKKAREE